LGSAIVDFEPTAEEKEFGARARRFAEEVIRSGAERTDAGRTGPAEIIRQLGELQMMGVAVPREDGGCGRGHVEYVLALIEIIKGSALVGAAMFVNNSLYSQTLLEFGKKEQRRKYLRPCAAGEGTGAVPLNYPILDPDLISMASARSGERWLLSGRQDLTANGLLPTHCILPASAGDGKSREISLFVVDLRNTPGLRLERGDDLVESSETAVLASKEAALPEDALLGEQGEGLNHMMKTRPKIWIGSSAYSVGIGRVFLDAAVNYSLKGRRMGRSVFSSQAVQHALADTATAMDAAELLTLKAAWLADQGKPFEIEAAMAKLYASDAAMKSAVDATQIMGEEGWSRRNPFWDLMRHAKKCQIEQESNLRMKGVITGHLVRDLKG
jgi:alkylation response protein AidB-like acyl-CoA dehydrogenase